MEEPTQELETYDGRNAIESIPTVREPTDFVGFGSLNFDEKIAQMMEMPSGPTYNDPMDTVDTTPLFDMTERVVSENPVIDINERIRQLLE